MIRCLSQLDNDNAGYAEKLLQATTVGKYCEKLVGIIQVIESLGLIFRKSRIFFPLIILLAFTDVQKCT